MLYRLLFLVFLSFSLNAQYSIKHYSTIEGLPHDLCYAIIQDSKGFIWLGTDDGLLKFDGTNFKKINVSNGLKSNYVIDITQVDSKLYTIATWGGGMQLLKDDKPVPFKNEILYGKKINKIGLFNDAILAKGSGDNFYLFDYQKNNILELPFSVHKKGNKLTIDSYLKKHKELTGVQFESINRQIYFFNDIFQSGLQLNGIYQLKSKTNVQLCFPFLKDQYINDLKKSEVGNFYAISNDFFYVFDEKKILFKKAIPVTNKNVRHVYFYKNTVALTLQDSITKLDEVIIWNLESDTIFTIDKEQLRKKQISDLLIDRDGNAWISTFGNGVLKVIKEERAIKNVIKNDNVLDITKFKDDNLFLHPNKLSIINTLTNKKDSLFIDENLWRFNYTFSDAITIKTKTNKTIRLSNSIKKNQTRILDVEEFLVNYNGKIVKFGDNYFFIKNGKFERRYLENENINIRKIIHNDKLLYIASNKGVYIFDLENEKIIDHYYSKNGLVNDEVRDLVFKKNVLYVATVGGLSIIEKQKITNYTNNYGLLSTNINSLCLDHFGVLWLGTQKGFSLFKNNQFYSFYKNDNVFSTSTNKIFENSNNIIWIAGNNGVVKIDNSLEFKPEEILSIEVEKYNHKIFLDVISFSEYDIIREIKINEFAWEPFSTNEVDFSNYQYGNYTVKFRARSLNSDWKYTNPVTLTLKAPWYKQWWAYAIITTITLAIVSLFFFLRISHVRKRNTFLKNTMIANENLQKELKEVRENVAQDFHDELGNKLAGITVLSNLMKENEEDKDSKKYQQIMRIHKDAEDLYYGIKDFIWSIDSKNDDVNELIFYLKDFGEELFNHSPIEFEVINKIQLSEIKLPYYWARQILLLFKEAMTNAFKYSQASKCVLIFEFQDLQLIISQEDNGVGFNRNELQRINGLNNMQKRADKIGAKLNIDSERGTRILLSCNLN